MMNPSASYIVPPDGYRLPGDLRLGPVSLQVADLTRSTDWYGRVLGLRASDESGSVALQSADGTTLVRLHEYRNAAPVPRRGRLGLYHYAILLPDRAALGRFLSHVGQIDERIGASDHLVSEALYLTDPDGLGIEVYADRPASSWRLDGTDLAMATDPLDVRGVMAAAGAAPWQGMPAGTRMGHLHLHVGDLDEGAAFYHAALGLDRLKLKLPGALFMSAGGYHHHLGTNIWARDARPAGEGDARLLAWTLELPTGGDVAAAAASLRAAGYPVDSAGPVRVSDPWGTTLLLGDLDQQHPIVD